MLELSVVTRYDHDNETVLTPVVRPRDATDVLPELGGDVVENPMRRFRGASDLAENGADDAGNTPFWGCSPWSVGSRTTKTSSATSRTWTCGVATEDPLSGGTS